MDVESKLRILADAAKGDRELYQGRDRSVGGDGGLPMELKGEHADPV